MLIITTFLFEILGVINLKRDQLSYTYLHNRIEFASMFRRIYMTNIRISTLLRLISTYTQVLFTEPERTTSNGANMNRLFSSFQAYLLYQRKLCEQTDPRSWLDVFIIDLLLRRCMLEHFSRDITRLPQTVGTRQQRRSQSNAKVIVDHIVFQSIREHSKNCSTTDFCEGLWSSDQVEVELFVQPVQEDAVALYIAEYCQH